MILLNSVSCSKDDDGNDPSSKITKTEKNDKSVKLNDGSSFKYAYVYENVETFTTAYGHLGEYMLPFHDQADALGQTNIYVQEAEDGSKKFYVCNITWPQFTHKIYPYIAQDGTDWILQEQTIKCK
ncbi:MAG: hypothetical protein K6G31_02275 [Paludibacteraceae bacterium]|nr:hypothetical protein [Paludibacteraceae bacterium]